MNALCDTIRERHERWEKRKRRSLRRASDRKAAEALLARILAWSGRMRVSFGRNAGDWVTGMEYTCWRRCPSLRALAAKAGGWWVWADGEVFVAWDAWQTLRKAQERHEYCLVEHLRARSRLERLRQRLER